MRAILLGSLLALSILGLGCTASGGGSVGRNGDVVGGTCTASGGCASGSECLTASMYPGGMCSVVCSAQADCPTGSTCISEGGGRCVLPCSSASDCRDGYNCASKSLEGRDGEARVCIR
jgi:hypothetical protein